MYFFNLGSVYADRSFFVKGKMRALSMCGKKYSSIPNNSVAGADVSTTTGFNSLKENGCPS